MLCDRRRKKSRAQSLVEFTLVVLPVMALIFLTMDTAWAIFARATLQHAAREGVRYAVTATPLAGSCMNASIQQVVQQHSFGFIPVGSASTSVIVTYYDPTTLTAVTGANSTAAGNVVQVSIKGVSLRALGPLWRNSTPLSLGAQAADVMEASPTGPPCA